MMKNIIFLALLVVLTVVLVFGGCAQTASGPTSSPTRIIEISFAHHEPPVAGSAKVYAEWAKNIEEQSQGKVKISMYPAQSLVNLRDLWSSVTGGIADIGLAVLAESSQDLPLASVMMQSPTGIPNGIPGLHVWDELWATVPELKDEFKEVKMLWYFVASASSLHTMDKEVRVPDDVKGMKVVCPPGVSETEFMRWSGATPVALPAPEWYMALERGMGEAGMFPYTAMRIFGTMELFKYHVDCSYGPNMLYTFMNIDKWNSLPPDVQKVFEELSPPMNELLTNFKADEENEIRSQAKDMGHTFIELTPEEQNKWDTAVASASDKWIKETEALGKPAGKVFEKAKELAKKYNE